mgnify:CR=1 FL=1
MLTSCYSQWSKIWTPGGISISRTQKNHAYPVYAPLVPGDWCFDIKTIDYIKRYEAQLSHLDARTVWEELKEMAIDDAIHRFGLDEARALRVEPVMLCWEKPGGTSAAFCHRRLVAQWLQSELGVIVPEGHIDKKGCRVITPSFDTLCRIEPDGTFTRLSKETNQGQGTLNLF